MKYHTSPFLLVALLILSTALYGVKHGFSKVMTERKPRRHPYTHLLKGRAEVRHPFSKSTPNNKLLAILVDFQEEIIDDPMTTGNGKFLLTEDPSYKASIGSPPHNREYFEANLDALRYYYLAASQGSFNLQFDIYPQDNSAYTLSQRMSYYNPVGASASLFLSRIEEYFKEAFELADSLDPEIDFAQYGHFMIIHAGSDWQHDFMNNTPADLPSFHITVGEGKEAVVDNGTVLINHASNVPSTISQDFDSYLSGGVTYYTGYGALNGVLAHEFGHSLGLVDLYNTFSLKPMVGQFDIMDSGGSVVIEIADNPGVLLEGVLPALPGAFSRMLMFGDSFKQRGLFIELNQMISNLTLSDYHSVSASSQKQPTLNPVPNIIKIPLNDHEYLLIENRSVDPDNDGNTSLKSALNGRVALYPTPELDPLDTPTYEYDYLLPSFVDLGNNAIGGGILVWHVDENVLYNEGKINADGSFTSNFANNTVNLSLSHRGVRIIEADGLNDLGNEYSWYWTGTPFEYFHKHRPNLNQHGIFVNWSTTPWRPTLSAESNPPLLDNRNHPAFFGLDEISQPSATMTFKLSAGAFDTIYALGSPDSLQIVMPVINSDIIDNVLPVWRNDMVHFYMYEPSLGLNKWTELVNPLQIPSGRITFAPVLSDLNNNGIKEVIIPLEDKVVKVEFDSDSPRYEVQNVEATGSPLFAFGQLFVSVTESMKNSPQRLEDKGFPISSIEGKKLAATDEHLIVLTSDRLTLFNPDTNLPVTEYVFPERFGQYEPIAVKNVAGSSYTYFAVSDAGNIYKCFNNEIRRIFINEYSTVKPTNLAVCTIGNYSPCLLFGLQNKIYAITQDGTLLPGYPKYFEDYTFEPLSHIRTITSGNKPFSDETSIIKMRVVNGGLLAISTDGQIDNFNSIIYMKPQKEDIPYHSAVEQKLHWFFVDNGDNLIAAEIWDQSVSYFCWSGFRNGSTGQISLVFTQPPANQEPLNAFVLPNPVENGVATVRVENPDGKISLYIYDISGKLLHEQSILTDSVMYRDIQIDVSKYSSGVYLAVVENKNKIRRTKFAIER